MNTERHTRRPWLRLAAVAAAGSLALSACAQGDEQDAGSDGAIRVAWWGSEVRHSATEEALGICEDKIGDVEIEGEYASQGGGYGDRLATQFAAGNPPDIIQVNSPFITSYGQRGSLLALDEVSEHLDLEDIPDAVMETDKLDGTAYSVPITKNASAVLLNTTLLEENGLEPPDHEDWTWEDFAAYAEQASQAGDGDFWGVEQITGDNNLLTIWARQMGIDDGIYTPDGEVGVDASVVESFIAYGQQLQESGAAPSASITTENQGVALEQRMAATNRSVLSIQPMNEVIAVMEASGSDFELLPLPVHEPGSNGQTFRSLAWSITAETAQPDKAAQVVNCLQADLDVAEVLLAERGIPANQAVLEHIKPMLGEGQQMMAERLTALEETAPDNAPVPPPAGSESARDLLRRVTADVGFGRIGTEEAAEQFISELDSSLEAAN